MEFRKRFKEIFLHQGSCVSLDEEHLLIGWGPRKWGQLPKVEDGAYWYFPDFFLTKLDPWFTHAFQAIVTISELESIISEDAEHVEVKWEPLQSTLFFEMMSDLEENIANGYLLKGVPFAFQQSEQLMTPKLLQNCLSHLLKTNQKTNSHLYGFWDERGGILGATPEFLFQMDQNRHLKTIAVAGTSTNKENLQDPKIEREHRLVIDGIIESLFSLGILSLGKTTFKQFGSLYHLITPIEIALRAELPYEHYVQILHPTPALGAYPRHFGDKWLAKWQQKIDRKRFGAPCGCLLKNGEKAVCLVAIRNIQWDREGLSIAAGAGVVKESLPQNEWDEVRLKIDSIKNMMNLQET